jgi:hypothetical protein
VGGGGVIDGGYGTMRGWGGGIDDAKDDWRYVPQRVKVFYDFKYFA